MDRDNETTVHFAAGALENDSTLLGTPIGFMIKVGIAQGKERIDTSYDRDKIFSWGEGERGQASERD